MYVVETHQLTKRYGELLAVDRLSISVRRGVVFGFLGPNGSGKTTTIGMLLGVITPSDGTFRLLGERSGQALRNARLRIGATLETPNFYPYLSGRDNLRITANVKRVGTREVDRVLDAVGLTGRQHHRFGSYSLGMKQRLALAATMLGDPELIILDEPANGLDPEGMREIREIIRGLSAQGRTVFLSSHLLNEVERTCTHVAVIKNGVVLRQSAVQELTDDIVIAEVRSPDLQRLSATAERYPGARTVRLEGDAVLVELTYPDLARLSEYLAAQGVFPSHLARRKRSLEEVFMELTTETT